jgi:hypothetical protein
MTRAAGSVRRGEMVDDDPGVVLREAARAERAERHVPCHAVTLKGRRWAGRVSASAAGGRITRSSHRSVRI